MTIKYSKWLNCINTCLQWTQNLIVREIFGLTTQWDTKEGTSSWGIRKLRLT